MPVGSLRSSKAGVEALWAWLQSEWDTIYTKFPASSTMISSIVKTATSGLTTKEQLDAVNAFFKDREQAGYDRGLAQSIDSIKSKMEWVNRDNADLRAWLSCP